MGISLIIWNRRIDPIDYPRAARSRERPARSRITRVRARELIRLIKNRAASPAAATIIEQFARRTAHVTCCPRTRCFLRAIRMQLRAFRFHSLPAIALRRQARRSTTCDLSRFPRWPINNASAVTRAFIVTLVGCALRHHCNANQTGDVLCRETPLLLSRIR